MTYKICEDVQLLKKNYDEPVDILDGLPHKQSDIIRMVEFYSNSRYLNGQKDERNHRKSYYQMINGQCDVENAAVDIDTKDMRVTSDDKDDQTLSMLMTKDIYQWMKDSNYALSLNKQKKTRTKYGSLLVKKVIEKNEDGERMLTIEVPEWKNLITDQVDIINNPTVEVHYMTPLQLMKKANVWDGEMIKDVVDKARKAGPGKRIAVYEVRGEFPLDYYLDATGEEKTENEDKENEFSYQLYYLVGGVESKKEQKMEDLKVLYAENNTERVYKYLDRKARSGRGFGVGVFEEGEEAQVMVNDAILKQNRAMAYTSKVIGQSASKKLKGRNMMDEVDDGTILEHEENKPISTLSLLPAGGLGQYESLVSQWVSQFERVTSGYAAQRGETPPSGTPFRLQAMVVQQSSSVFIDLQEEFGIFQTEIFNDWVMPFLASRLNKAHILAWEFTPQEMMMMDRNYAIRERNRKANDMILDSLIIPTEEQLQKFYDEADAHIKSTGGMRFVEIMKNEYKKAKKKVTVNPTGEQRNKAAALETLNNILITYSKIPNLASDPVLSMLLMEIIEVSGSSISSSDIMSAIEEQKKAQKEQPLTPADATATPGTPSPMTLAANPTPDATGVPS
jgi:hypothetical protein